MPTAHLAIWKSSKNIDPRKVENCILLEILGIRTIKNRNLFLLSKSLYTNTLSSILTVCSCHVRYAFQSESTLYSCLNVKELLARSRGEIWSFKWLSVFLRTVWFWAWVQLQSLLFWCQNLKIRHGFFGIQLWPLIAWDRYFWMILETHFQRLVHKGHQWK